jgi:hypothetical protein
MNPPRNLLQSPNNPVLTPLPHLERFRRDRLDAGVCRLWDVIACMFSFLLVPFLFRAQRAQIGLIGYSIMGCTMSMLRMRIFTLLFVSYSPSPSCQVAQESLTRPQCRCFLFRIRWMACRHPFLPVKCADPLNVQSFTHQTKQSRGANISTSHLPNPGEHLASNQRSRFPAASNFKLGIYVRTAQLGTRVRLGKSRNEMRKEGIEFLLPSVPTRG